MKICLINPPRLVKLMSTTFIPSPPLGLAYIAGALKNAGCQLQIIDAIGSGAEKTTEFIDDIYLHGLTEEDIADKIEEDTDIIGLSLMFTNNWMHNKILIDYLGEKHPHSIIIAGGEHITAVPEFSLAETKHLTICVLGEGEDVVIHLLEALKHNRSLESVPGIVFRDKHNRIVKTPGKPRIKELNSIERPEWSLFPLAMYKKHNFTLGVEREGFSMPVLATRGCPYSCTFCSSPQMWGTRYYMRDHLDVVNEIEFLKNEYGCSNFDFYDLTAIIKKEWILEFSKELLRRELHIKWQIPGGTRSEAIDREVAHYLFKSGCRNITYAPESGSVEMLRLIKKKVSIPSMLRSISDSHKERLNVKLNIILGFPEEEHKHLWQTIWFLVKASWYGANDMYASPFSPYPGSELFNKLMEEGKINMNKKYFYRIFCTDTFIEREFYSNKLSNNFLRFYTILYFSLFYSSNFLFRPVRLFKIFRNLLLNRQESRLEKAIHTYIKRFGTKSRLEKRVIGSVTR